MYFICISPIIIEILLNKQISDLSVSNKGVFINLKDIVILCTPIDKITDYTGYSSVPSVHSN